MMPRLFLFFVLITACFSGQAAVPATAPKNSPQAEIAQLQGWLRSPEGPVEQAKIAEDAARDLNTRRAALANNEKMAGEWVAQSGLTRIVGQFLRAMRQDLPDPAPVRAEMRETQKSMNQAQDRIVILQSRRAKINLPPKSKSRDLPAQQARALDDLIAANQHYRQTLFTLYQSQQAYVAQIKSLDDFIAERVLWMRGAPLEPATFQATWDAARWLFDPARWAGAVQALGADVYLNPLLYIVAGIVLLLLWRVRQLIIRHANRILPDPPHKRPLLFSTLHLSLSFLRSIFWPLLLWFAGWRLLKSADATVLGVALGHALNAVALAIFAISLTVRLCRKEGFFAFHFHSGEQRLQQIRRALAGLSPLFLLAFFLLMLIEGHGGLMDHRALEAYRYSLGRFVLLLMLLVLGVMVFQAFGAGGYKDVHHPWRERLRNVSRPALLALLAVLMVLSGLGYYESSLIILQRLAMTYALVFCIVVAYAAFTLWLREGMRHLANERTRRKLARQRLAGAAAQPEESQQEVDLRSVNTQTFNLVRIGVALGLIAGLWLIWADVLPALTILRRIPLWTVVKPVPPAAAGTAAAAASISRIISLADVVIALVILFFVAAANRNLPGLLEVAVLQHSPLEAATRYAITAVARYCVLTVGIIWAAHTIGIGWDEVRWLAAAITVGLGFGLQEIFANFVSGLIILFERPVRIGDKVTIGGSTGTVMRIHIRATVLLDEENKELIVPNRQFITQPVTNWSLQGASGQGL